MIYNSENIYKYDICRAKTYRGNIMKLQFRILALTAAGMLLTNSIPQHFPVQPLQIPEYPTLMLPNENYLIYFGEKGGS